MVAGVLTPPKQAKRVVRPTDGPSTQSSSALPNSNRALLDKLKGHQESAEQELHRRQNPSGE